MVMLGSSPASSPSGDSLVKEGSTATFMTDVVEASYQAAVVVDFWAPWCGPCRQLGPALEKAVREARGAVRMVKINIDNNPELAQQLRIQSIPAVYAFRDGRPVDGFVGALPESQIKRFVAKLAGEGAASPIAEALEQAKAALEEGDIGTAGTLYGQILAHEPQNVAALAGMARCYVASNQLDQARQILDSVPDDQAGNAEVAAARSALELAEQASQAGPIPELMERVAHDPDDHQARFDLAMALFAAGKPEAALGELLELFRRDRGWNDEAARKQLLKFFEALGPTHPLTLQTRRRLSSLMFS